MTLVVQTERLRTAVAERYRVERKLGSGGMATVYLAEDVRHGRKVAIKVLEPSLAAALGVERFLREIEIAAKLTHPHILGLHDSGDADGLLYYVMPYVDGESLRERLAREKQPSLSDATRILKEVIDALAYAHANGVVHRDIKPDNVMLSGRHALVTDFGIAKALSEVSGQGGQQQLTSFGVAIGTPQYMAPEQAAGEADIDYRADIYSVGIVAYEMLAGRPPFSGTSIQQLLRAQVDEIPEPLGQLRPDLPAGLVNAVMRCLAKDPAKRWQSAHELLAELEAVTTPAGGTTAIGVTPAGRRGSRRLWLLGGGVLLAGLAWAAWGFGLFGLRHDEKWLRTEILPEIHRLADTDHPLAAHLLAMKAAAARPGDPLLEAVFHTLGGRVTITSEPPGARVLIRDYEGTDLTWNELGKTPLNKVWFPTAGFYRLRLELEGYRPYEAAAGYWWLKDSGRFPLDKVGAMGEGLVQIPGGTPAGPTETAVALGDYLLDRYEVTNRRYKAFVDAGGYQRKEFWHQPFQDAGRELTFEEAMARFIDRTGRPGPSTWELSDFPKGEADYPVSGVSWYEASAYAAFEGRDLPTVFHWNRAAGAWGARWIVPASNFSGKGPAPVGQYPGIGRFGASDMAGNVREWCSNEELGPGGGRFILGGGWNDAPYSYVERYAQSAWDRSVTNGFRLVTYRDSPEALKKPQAPIARVVRDYSKETPVGDAEFKVYLRQYAYDRTPLNAVIEQTDTTEDWTRQKVSFDAAYGKERMLAYVFIPKKGSPPYQPIILFPGSGAIYASSIDQDAAYWDFIVRSGRVLVQPIYRGTLDRRTELNDDEPNGTASYRDYVIQWARDLGRTIDYLETRDDMNVARAGYFGVSWGGMMGGLMPAVETRLKVAVLLVAGLDFGRPLPEADPFNFLPRIHIPVLMLNGRLDHFFPVETSQVPMFQLLGTPPEQKRQLIYDAGHLVPRSQVIKETLDWFDKYLGPVQTLKASTTKTN
jgi:eukaryotic-like serine/threonine-protein kinase